LVKGKKNSESVVNLVTSPQDYFSESVKEAIEKRKLETTPFAEKYLVMLLESHLTASNLNIKTTLAERLLKANLAEKKVKIEMLKQLGDLSLYISGFFGDSLRRKIVDLDYYADIGGMAYNNLAHEIDDDIHSSVFLDFSKRFVAYVDILTYISQHTLIQSNQDLLRLYERYVITGSELAREQLVEKGLIANEDIKKSSNQ
jgi:Mor family transcriptional regulator